MKLLRNFGAASVLGIATLAAVLVTSVASPAKDHDLKDPDVVIVGCAVVEIEPVFQFLSASEETFDLEPVFSPGKTLCSDVWKFLLLEGFVNVRETREVREVVEGELSEIREIVIVESVHLPSPGIVEKKVPFLWTFIRERNGNGIGEPAE